MMMNVRISRVARTATVILRCIPVIIARPVAACPRKTLWTIIIRKTHR